MARMATAPSERRESSRVSLDTIVQLRLGDEIRQAQLLDIGEGGLRIATGTRFAEQTPVTVFLPMPRQETGKRRLHLASGSVVWSDEEREAGICFDALPAETLGQIRDYVARQSGLDLVDLAPQPRR